MKHAPCKPNGIDCDKRTVGCSRTCPLFLEWEQYKNNIKAERRKEVDRWAPTGRRYDPRISRLLSQE